MEKIKFLKRVKSGILFVLYNEKISDLSQKMLDDLIILIENEIKKFDERNN